MKIYNTLSRNLENFKPLRYPEVKLYQCGPTVYNHAHIWNLKTSLVEDMVARSLKFLGYKVKITMNITDIDDKTIRDSIAAWETLSDFTQKYTDIFMEDLQKLWVEIPDTITPISTLIPEMVRMIQTMLNRGYAYLADDGSIYYDISKYKKYGNLANLDILWMKTSVRIDNDEYDKEQACDFVLWKAWKDSDGENFWEENFSIDDQHVVLKWRPGWHIECSACAMKHFGQQIDIHMWGEDLVFPHHQNEIAQTEACTGKKFSKYWLHSGHVMVGGKKMSKSLWNFYTLRHIEEKYKNCPELYRALRYTFLNGKYRDQIDFSFEKLDSSINTIKKIDSTLKNLMDFEANEVWTRDEFREYMQDVIMRFVETLEDDFAMSEAFAVFFDFQKYAAHELHKKTLSEWEVASIIDMYANFNAVFGIIDFDIQDPEIPQGILDLAQKRDEAKAQKDYASADAIRDEILQAGYSVKDSKEGTIITQ